MAMTNPELTEVDAAHSGAFPPELTCKICPADPNASRAGVFAADAYGMSPCVVNTISIVLLAGKVQNTSNVLDPPELKLTKLSELEDEITVVLYKVSGVASVTVPFPTSKLFVPCSKIQ